MDWFKIGKGVCQDCILSSCLFNLDADYIMQNSGLKESQAGIKIVKRNINNLRYADDSDLFCIVLLCILATSYLLLTISTILVTYIHYARRNISCNSY